LLSGPSWLLIARYNRGRSIGELRDAIREYLEVARQLASGAQAREVDVPV